MLLKIYVKQNPAERIKAKRRDRGFFGFIAAIGFFAIIISVVPYFYWQFKTLPRLNSQIENAPVPQSVVLSSVTVQGQDVEIIKDAEGFSYFSTNTKPQGPRSKNFYMSVPKLNIEKALVKVDNLNFYQSLSHFPGTALPGEIGNSFITGHSVLPEFADPKNYRSIFTKLSDLEVGDDIYVQMNNQNFHYVVLYSKVVDPKDVSVLGPISQNSKNLTLMTCVPPGSSTKRLVVVTTLI